MIKTNINIFEYRAEIDGLRGLAIFAVLINHFNSDLLPSGFLGVDIFFVISGYVITASLTKRKVESFWSFIINFYKRRIRRIFPALFLCILLSSIATFFIVPQPQIIIRTGIASLFGLSNLYLHNNTFDYFTESADLNIFTQTWSLGIEEQFYFIFPVVFWFSGITKNPQEGIKKLFKIILSLSIISLVSYLIVSPINQNASYYLIQYRFWEIASGCIVFILQERKGYLYNLVKKMPSTGIFLLIIIILFLPQKFFILSTILINILTCILIICLKEKSIVREFLSKHQIIKIGKLSYSLYLWHWSLLVIARWSFGINKTTILPLMILIFLLSYLSYQYIEKPFRHKKEVDIFKYFSLLMFGLGTSLFLIQRFDDNLYRSLYIGKRQEKNLIKFTKEQNVYFIGDSYARDLFTLIKPSGKRNIKTAIKGGCAYFYREKNKYRCKDTDKVWKKILKESIPGDIIFAISSQRSSDFKNREDLLLKILPILERKEVTLITNHPFFPSWELNNFNGYLCQKEWFRPKLKKQCFQLKASKIDLKKHESSKEMISFKKFENQFKNFKFIDYSKILCSEEICMPFKEGEILTHDGYHLYRGSPFLTKKFSNYINKLLD